MAATITWSISQFETAPSEGDLVNVVKTAHWRCDAVETVTVDGEEVEYNAGAYGSVGFAAPDSESFTAYDDITKANGIQWVKDELGSDYVTSLEEGLVNNIEKQKNPPIVKLPLPWAGS